METKSTHNIPPVKVASPVEAIKVAAVEQIASKLTRRWRISVFQAYLLIATTAFGILFGLASMFNYFSMDLSVTRVVQTINVAWFTSLMWWISFFGYAPQIFILVATVVAILFLIGLRWELS